MGFDRLLEYLDIERPEEFEYFECMADLLEYDGDIDDEAIYTLFKGADRNIVAELIEDYFEDILDGLPEDQGEVYQLLHQIKLGLEGMIMNAQDDADIRRFADEISRFRQWYTKTSETHLISKDSGDEIYCCIRDLITYARMERLGGEKYSYDAENALDYELDSYIVSFSDLAAAEDDYNEGQIVFTPGEEDTL